MYKQLQKSHLLHNLLYKNWDSNSKKEVCVTTTRKTFLIVVNIL